MIKGFKDFIMRGNVVDLAIAVVIGAAFGSVITAFTEKVVQPLINAMGGAEAKGLSFQLVEGGTEKTVIDLAAVITAGINFLMVALVIYLVLVVPMNKFNERRRAGEVTDEAPAEDIALLREIRDSLVRR